MAGRALTTEQAAREFFVKVELIEAWTARGHLRPAAPGLYLEDDVAEAERRTRRKPRATRLAWQALNDTPEERT